MTALPTLNEGDTGAAVETLQTDLNAAGANPVLKVDGNYGPLTYAAVIKFKLKHNLTDGTVGPVTWGALSVTPPPPPPPPPGWKNTYSGTGQVGSPGIGDTGFSANSNGFNTYVENQNVGMNTPNSTTLNVNNAQNWQAITTLTPAGSTGVQGFLSSQQLFNDYQGGSGDYPLSALKTLMVTYDIVSPGEPAAIYEFAPDVWTNYPADIMFWVDTSHTRCVDNGLNSSNILGQAVLGGQNWTLYRYGGAGGELIFMLNSASNTDPVSNGTAAQQRSGTIDVLAGLKWLADNSIASFPAWTSATLSMLNTGWEITSATNATFTVNNLTYTVT